MRYASLLLALGFLAHADLAAAQDAVPPAPRVDSADVYFGTRVPDPYRWLEQYQAPEVRRWYEQEAALAQGFLEGIPALRAFLQAYGEARQGLPHRISLPQYAGTWTFYTKQMRGETSRSLYVRAGDGTERRLVAPDQLRSDTAAPAPVIAGYLPSPDGRHVVLALVSGGDERNIARVVETETGRLLDSPFPASEVVWSTRGDGLYYRPVRQLPPGAPGRALYGGLPVRFHALGTEPAADPVVFDPLAFGADSSRVALVFGDHDGHLLVGIRHPGRTQETDLFVAPSPRRDVAEVAWRRVASAQDSVAEPFIRGGFLYAASSRGAPNGRLVRTSLARPDWTTAQTVVPEGGTVLWENGFGRFAAARDAFYLVRDDNGRARLFRVPFDGRAAAEVETHAEGSFGELSAQSTRDGVAFAFGGWTGPDRLYRVDPAQGRMELLPEVFNPPDPFGTLPGMTAETVLVRSHDGVMVPLTLLRGPGPAGARPTILSGYGAYGSTDDAFFRPPLRPWLAAGGAYAFCHVRGGGYFGREWREAGMMARKPNTWRDGIACAEHLVRTGATTREQLGLTGTSAGGIFAGRAMTERPDLFRAVVIEVGSADMVRFHRDGSGPANADEFGTVETEAGFRSLLAMSPYHHVREGVRYPATMLYAGFNDARVTPWHPGKMAAALRHAGGPDALPGGERPVLLHVDFGTGHGTASSTQQTEARRAAALAFFADRLGLSVPQ